MKLRGLLTVSLLILGMVGSSLAYTGAVSRATDDAQTYKHAQQAFALAAAKLKKKNFEESIGLFSKVVEIMPNHSDAQFCLGVSYYNTGDIRKALSYFEEAKRTHAAFQKIKHESELQEFYTADELITKYENEKDYLKNLEITDGCKFAVTQARIGFLTERVRQLKEKKTPVLSDKIPFEYHFHIGNCQMKLKNYGEAFNAFVLTIKENPQHGESYNNLAVLNYMVEEYEPAWTSLQIAKKYGATINQEFEISLKEKLGK